MRQRQRRGSLIAPRGRRLTQAAAAAVAFSAVLATVTATVSAASVVRAAVVAATADTPSAAPSTTRVTLGAFASGGTRHIPQPMRRVRSQPSMTSSYLVHTLRLLTSLGFDPIT